MARRPSSRWSSPQRWSAWARPPRQALLGSHIRIGRDRGQPIESELADLVTVTTHPSAILRTDDEDREQAMEQFVADLEEVAQWLSTR